MSIILLLFIAGLIGLTLFGCIVRPFWAIIGLLCLRGFWDATQQTAIPGVSWWANLYSESGPLLLPVIAVLVVLLIIRITVLPLLTTKGKIKFELPSLLVIATILLGTFIGIVHQNDAIRVFKDIAFFSGFLLIPGISKLNRRQAESLFVTALAIHAVDDLLFFKEALARKNYYGHDLQMFLNHFYRIFKADHFGPVITLLGFFWGLPKKSFKLNTNKVNTNQVKLLRILFLYFGLRFAFNFTRLNWIALAMTIGVYVFLLPSQRNLKRLIGITISLILAVIGTFIFTAASTGDWDISNQGLIQRLQNIDFRGGGSLANGDISIRFRITESIMLWQSFMHSPLVGNGFGATLSPNDPDEPTRNNISDFFNGYFGLLYKLGLIGTTYFLGALGLLFRKIIRLRRQLLDPFQKAMLNGAFVYFLGIALIMPLSDTLTSNFYSITFSVTIGCAIAACRPLLASNVAVESNGV